MTDKYRLKMDEDFADYYNDNYTPEEQMAMFYRGLGLAKLREENKENPELKGKKEDGNK